MSRFSKKYGFDEKVSKEIIEDFPEWTRVALLQILEDLLYVDMDSRYSSENRPLGIKKIHKDFSSITRIEMDQDDYDSWLCQERLFDHLKSTPWYYVYDFIELVSKELKLNEINYLFEDEKLKEFGFNSFQKKINDLFKEDNFVWRLNEKGEISRNIPEVLLKTVTTAENELEDKFEPARNHYKKAINYIFSIPIDSENGIKEIVSAIESIGRTIYPKTSTLGQVIKELKKESEFPKLLVDVIDKIYIFSNATPSIRHGGTSHSNLKIEDAEFVFYTGVSLIRYLMKLDKIKNNT
ncbi:AbiJ-NTD4 domain-containing protein [Polaribacter sp. M15]